MFDTNSYLDANPDLLWAWMYGGDAYVSPADKQLGIAAWAEKHYNTYGQAEGRPIGMPAPAPAPEPAPAPIPAPQPAPSPAPAPTGLLASSGQTLTQAQLDQLMASRDTSLDGQWGINPQGTPAGEGPMMPATNPTALLPTGSGQYGLFNIVPQSDGTYTLSGGSIQGSPSQINQQISDISASQDASFNQELGLGAAALGGLAALQGGLFGGAEAGALNSFDTGAMASAMGYTPGMSMPFTAAMMGGEAASTIAPAVATGASGAVGSVAAPAAANAAAPVAAGTVGSALAPAVGAGAGSALGGLFSGLPAGVGSALVGGAANLIGMGLQNQTNKDIAEKNAALQREANENSKFRPVGVTTRFGQSQFGYDANGRLTSAGYNLSPELKAMQDRQMGMLPQLQTDYERAAALGRGAMKTPEQYMQEQLGLLAPTREQGLANIRNQAQQTGRGGLATMGTSTMMATNPEMAAYYNAIQQENARLAANAPQQSLALANQGLGLMSQGYQPFATALGGAQNMETLGQHPMDLGTGIGAQQSTANARLPTPQMPNQVNPWTAGLMGGVNAYNTYQNRQPVTTQNPYVPQQPTFPYTVNPTDQDWNNNAGIWGY